MRTAKTKTIPAPGSANSGAQPQPLYESLANMFADQIAAGTLAVGEKLPSLRQAALQHGVSVATLREAYDVLVSRGFAAPAPRSGFFATRPHGADHAAPKPQTEAAIIPAVDVDSLAADILENLSRRDLAALGGATLPESLLPIKSLGHAFQNALRQPGSHSYVRPAGFPDLTRRIAGRAALAGLSVSAEQVIITRGCIDGLHAALSAITKPGDLVAIESPTFFGTLQLLQLLGLRAIEIPVDPHTGLDLSHLKSALRRFAIKACICVPSIHNPLGCLMPDDNKKELVRLLEQHDVPLIEDDIYAELSFDGGRRPLAAAHYARKSLAIVCSSFSKSLSPGLRIGYCLPGRFQEAIARHHRITAVAEPTATQMALARFLDGSGYERHLRALRRRLQQNLHQARDLIAKTFPAGTRQSNPRGGYLLWLELPKQVSASQLYRLALAKKISIAPGPMFCASDNYKHHIRLNYGHGPATHAAIVTVGKLACQLAADSAKPKLKRTRAER